MSLFQWKITAQTKTKIHLVQMTLLCWTIDLEFGCPLVNRRNWHQYSLSCVYIRLHSSHVNPLSVEPCLSLSWPTQVNNESAQVHFNMINRSSIFSSVNLKDARHPGKPNCHMKRGCLSCRCLLSLYFVAIGQLGWYKYVMLNRIVNICVC